MHKHYIHVACDTFLEHPTWAFMFTYDPKQVTCPECLELMNKTKEEK